MIKEKRRDLLNETAEERVQRLCVADEQQRLRHRKELEDEVYGGLSFTPQLDPLSRQLGKTADLQELVENVRGKTVREQAKMRVEQKESDECTFKPTINTYPVYAPSSSARGRGNQQQDSVDGSGARGRGRSNSNSYSDTHRPEGWSTPAADSSSPSYAGAGSCGIDETQRDGGTGAGAGVGYYHPYRGWQTTTTSTPSAPNTDGRPNHSQTPGGSGNIYNNGLPVNPQPTIDMKRPEKMARDIRLHLLEKEERRRAELVARD